MGGVRFKATAVEVGRSSGRVRPEPTEEPTDEGQERPHTALQAPRRARPEPVAQQKPEVECAAVNQDPFQDVGVAAQVRAAHAARLV